MASVMRGLSHQKLKVTSDGEGSPTGDWANERRT